MTMTNAFDAKTSSYRDAALLVGRILLAVLFLIAAYNKFKGYDGTVTYFTRLGVPMASMMAPVVELFEVVCALMLLVGYQTRLAAILLALFVVAAALFAHTNFGDGNQLNHFLKNLAIAGGCLALFSSGPGAYSLDAKRG